MRLTYHGMAIGRTDAVVSPSIWVFSNLTYRDSYHKELINLWSEYRRRIRRRRSVHGLLFLFASNSDTVALELKVCSSQRRICLKHGQMPSARLRWSMFINNGPQQTHNQNAEKGELLGWVSHRV